MSRRISFWGGLSLALLMLGGCLLADVGIEPQIDRDVDMAIASAQGSAGSGGSSGSNGAGGGSGSGSMPAAGAGGAGGSEAVPPVVAPPAAGGSANSGAAGGGGSAANAGSGNLPPNMGGAGGSGGALVPGAEESCPNPTDREEACFAYCELYTNVCQGFQAGPLTPYDYEGTLDCVDFCTNEANGWGVGTISSGNTILCRCAHAYLAGTQGRDPHCFHSARVPTAMCL